MKKILAILLMLAMLACSVPVLAADITPAAAPTTAPSCPHYWGSGKVTLEPTCTSEGLAEKKCMMCGLINGSVLVAKKDHDYSVIGTVIIEASCEKNGMGIYACSMCGIPESRNRLISAYGHSYSATAWVQATCTEDTRYMQTCARCGNEVIHQVQTGTALGHDVKEIIVTEASCTADGLAQTKCSRCDEVETIDRVIPKLGHSYKKYNSTATCTEEGVVGTICETCGHELGKVVRTPATGHRMEILMPVDPTCTTAGLTIGEHCSICKEVFQPQEEIPAKGHELEILLAKNPSCTETGLTIGEHCSVCKEVFQPQEIVPALGHKAVAIAGKPASCTATGLTQGSKCSVCSTVITAQQTIPMLEHIYELSSNGKNYICELCGDSLSAKPKDITINTKANIDVDLGDTLELDVIYSPADSFSPITWTSSNKKVVSIDEDGMIEALKEGSATITAKTANSKKDSIKIKVVDPYKVTKVELDQSGTIILGLGEELQLNAILYPETAETVLEWDSSSSRCEVDEDGLVTTVRTGSATITVESENGKKDSVKIKVVDPDEPYSVELSEDSTVYLTVGEEFQLDAVVYPETADTELSWRTSSSRCEVDEDGLVTAVRTGSATITVRTENGKRDSVRIKVTDD